MNFIKKNYRLILCILITILFLLLGFNFKYSFKRLPEVLYDLWNSIICFIDFILDLDMEVNPTILNPNDSIYYIFLPEEIDLFFYKIGLAFRLMVDFETISIFFEMFLNRLTIILKMIIILLPFIFLFKFILGKLYFRVNDKAANEESSVLIIYKKFLKGVIYPIKNWFKSFFSFVLERKYIVIIWALIWAFYLNVLNVFIQFLAFYFYFCSSFKLKSLYVIIYKTFVDLLPMIMFIPSFVWLILAFVIFHLFRKSRGYRILDHFENRNKGFINSLGQMTMTTGEPGKGKTSLDVDMVISLQTMFRNKAYEMILENDMMFPKFPFSKFEEELKRAIDYHQVYNLATARVWVGKKVNRALKNVSEEEYLNSSKFFDYDYETYGLIYDNGIKNIHLFQMLESYAQHYLIYITESSLIIANFSIRTDNVKQDLGNFPLWYSELFRIDPNYSDNNSKHAHILDFDMLRLGKKVVENNEKADALEFGIIVVSEIGKERGNQFDLAGVKRVALETNQKNDGFNDWMKLARHSATVDNYPYIKFFSDDQRAESFAADGRQLNEKVIFIAEKDEYKNTLMLFHLEEIIFGLTSNSFNAFYSKYRFYRKDDSFFMFLLKSLYSKYYDYFIRLHNIFGFNRLTLEHERGTLKGDVSVDKYYLMYKKIYSNRYATDCFADFFREKALNCKLGINDLQEYESERATLEEFGIQNSYFINKLIANNMLGAIDKKENNEEVEQEPNTPDIFETNDDF